MQTHKQNDDFFIIIVQLSANGKTIIKFATMPSAYKEEYDKIKKKKSWSSTQILFLNEIIGHLLV